MNYVLKAGSTSDIASADSSAGSLAGSAKASAENFLKPAAQW